MTDMAPAPFGGRGVAVGATIARLRRQQGLTQQQLADASHVGIELLRKIEQGRVAQPGLFRVVDIATALGIQVSALLPRQPHPVASVGYQGRDIDAFVSSLQHAGIDLLADVRLTPVSRKKGFSKKGLQAALTKAEVEYLHLPSLGNAKENRPLFAGRELAAGRARYRAGLHRDEARAALLTLAALRAERRVAVMCFENDERRCHRSVVVEELGQLG